MIDFSHFFYLIFRRSTQKNVLLPFCVSFTSNTTGHAGSFASATSKLTEASPSSESGFTTTSSSFPSISPIAFPWLSRTKSLKLLGWITDGLLHFIEAESMIAGNFAFSFSALALLRNPFLTELANRSTSSVFVRTEITIQPVLSGFTSKRSESCALAVIARPAAIRIGKRALTTIE